MKKIIALILSVILLIIVIFVVNFLIAEKNASVISHGNPIAKKSPVKQAVLVVDIQEGLTGKLAANNDYAADSDELIEKINQIVDSSAVKNTPVIYVKNEISNFLINMINNSLAKGSPGAELDSRLKIVSDYIMDKDKMDAFSNPMLDNILVKNNINKLVFVGLDPAYCINNTIEAAKNRNYDICVISDAVLSESEPLKNEMLGKFRQNGFQIIPAEDYFKNLSD